MSVNPYPADALILAPLSGYTDLAFRRQCRRQGCRYAFTPLVDVGSVVYRNPRSDRNLLRGDDEPWLGLQILGACPETVGECVRRLRDYPFDLVDLNMGCPMPKITRRGAGAALSDTPKLALRCLEAMVAAAPWPVTVKIRILDESDPAPTVALAQSLQRGGARALTVHGRIREKVYAGPVKFDVIAAVREALNIPVIANGGVVDRAAAAALRAHTGCGRLMIARGAIGNPWIFRELLDPRAPPPSHREVCTAMREQVADMVSLYGEDAGLRNARKIVLAYLVGRGYRRSRRHRVATLATWSQFDAFYREVLDEGPVDRSGSFAPPDPPDRSDQSDQSDQSDPPASAPLWHSLRRR